MHHQMEDPLLPKSERKRAKSEYYTESTHSLPEIERAKSEYSGESDHAFPRKQHHDKIQVNSDEKKKAKSLIYSLLFKEKLALIGIIPSFLFGISPMLPFLFLGQIVNELTKFLQSDISLAIYDPMPKILMYSLSMAGSCLILMLLKIADSYIWIRVGSKLSGTLKRNLFQSIMKSDVSFFDINSIGALLSVLSEDVQAVENAFGKIKGAQIQNLGQFILAIILSMIMNWRLSLIFLSTIPLTALVSFTLIPGLMKWSKIRFEHTGKSMTIAEESLSAIRTVKGCNREDLDFERFLDETKQSAYAEERIDFYVVIMVFFIILIIWGVAILILYIGAKLVNNKIMDVGNMFSAYGFSMMGAGSIGMLMNTMQGEQKAIDAGARIIKLTNYQADIPFEGGRIIPNFKGNIQFNRVCFKYPTRDSYALCDVSFVIEPGQMAALVGHSGSGKSTCVQLMERFYDIEEGEIYYDGVNIKDIDPRWLHRVIGLVSQEPTLMIASIKDNIKYGAPDATDEDVLRFAEIANCRKFIEKLDHGFDQEVGDKGSQLSGGQRQRIAIARAMIKNPIIFIADEATSALDSESEKKVQLALDQAMVGRTTVVVAHRLSTIRQANMIYVFDMGRIVEQGNHESLIERHEFYYKLIQRQMLSQK